MDGAPRRSGVNASQLGRLGRHLDHKRITKDDALIRATDVILGPSAEGRTMVAVPTALVRRVLAITAGLDLQRNLAIEHKCNFHSLGTAIAASTPSMSKPEIVAARALKKVRDAAANRDILSWV